MSAEYVQVESSYLKHKGKHIPYLMYENKIWVDVGVIFTIPQKLCANRHIHTEGLPNNSWYKTKVDESMLEVENYWDEPYELEYVPYF